MKDNGLVSILSFCHFENGMGQFGLKWKTFDLYSLPTMKKEKMKKKMFSPLTPNFLKNLLTSQLQHLGRHQK